MKHKGRMVLFAVILAGAAFGSVSELREGAFTVKPNPCPSCPMRMRFMPDGKTAFINTSRVSEKEFQTEARRAFELMKKGADTAKGGLMRPLMGWSSWNTFGLDIHEELIISIARTMATNGLKAAGYTYVNTDDGFFDGHDETTGRLKWNLKRFPRGMKPVVDAIHALGMKAGTYSDAGRDMCGGSKGSGLYGHDTDDCTLHFKELGFDFIKIDYCGGQRLKLDERARYTEIAKAIQATGRTDVRMNICRWAFPGTWAAEIAESWRTTEDIRANWNSIKKLIGENLYLGAYIRPGHYNDLDMLQVGRYVGEINNAYAKTDTGLTLEEEATHFGMWCFLSSPLLIGCDVRKLPETTYELVTNPYLLMMNQNDLASPPKVVQREGEAYVLVKDADETFGKARYLALYNAEDVARDFTVMFAKLGLYGKVRVFDLGERADLEIQENALSLNVPAHGAKFFRLDAEKRDLPDALVYEAEDAYLAEYQEIRDAGKSGTPHFVQLKGASGGVIVNGLGSRASNDLLWRDVRVPKNGLSLRVKTFDLAGTPRTYAIEVDGKPFREGEDTLFAGVHAVRLFNATQPLPGIDYLEVK